MVTRCEWSKGHHLLGEYHDSEWGVPLHDDRKLFEFLVLDSFQAGLSWLTILKKRENFRTAFDDFDYLKIANYNETQIMNLMDDNGIIRNRLKIIATVANAQSFIRVIEKFGTFDKYIWQFVKGNTIRNTWKTHADIPTRTTESDTMSKDMINRGFKFVGSTICYAFMQATGMVNDHTTDCFRYDEINRY